MGVIIKFKPWEASKLAGSLNKWLGPIGAVISIVSDVVGAYQEQEQEQEQKLQTSKDKISKMLKDTFQDLYDLMSDDNKIFAFFAPQLTEYEKVLAEMELGSNDLEVNRKQLAIIVTKLQSINLDTTNTLK